MNDTARHSASVIPSDEIIELTDIAALPWETGSDPNEEENGGFFPDPLKDLEGQILPDQVELLKQRVAHLANLVRVYHNVTMKLVLKVRDLQNHTPCAQNLANRLDTLEALAAKQGSGSVFHADRTVAVMRSTSEGSLPNGEEPLVNEDWLVRKITETVLPQLRREALKAAAEVIQEEIAGLAKELEEEDA